MTRLVELILRGIELALDVISVLGGGRKEALTELGKAEDLRALLVE
ncbi:hypothetical protein [Stigmatella hybrida]|nr:hypothetical protein [Stigmatella hybrida]